jgi:hypothetical protein
MKATLTFNLDDEDDSMAFSRCTQSLQLTLALLEMSNHLRSVTKYGEDEKEVEAYEKVSERFYEILAEQGINIDNLIR